MSLEAVLKQDRRISLAGLALILIIAWAYLLAGVGMGMSAWQMTRIPAAMDMGPVVWDSGYAVLMFFMWWIMMIAMMLPGAASVVLLAAALNRRSDPHQPPFGNTASFTLGYLLAWAGFSALAVAGQWFLQERDQISGMLAVNNTALAGALLIAAALWQLTPLKQACLRQCRQPAQWLIARRRPGHLGALRMGLEHGSYCLGCCGLLMLLLFVGGVMNLIWIVGLSVYVLAEKLLPWGRGLSYFTAGLLLAGGGWLCLSWIFR